MANLRELNSSNPFWDWVSEIERQNRTNSNNNPDNHDEGTSQRTTPLGDQEPLLNENDKAKEKEDHDMTSPPEFTGPPPPHFEDPPAPPPPEYHGPPPHHHDHHGHHGHPRRGHGGPHRGGPGFGRRGGHDHSRGGHHEGPWGSWGDFPPNFGIGWGPRSFPFGGRRGGCRGRNQWENMFTGSNGGFDVRKLSEWLSQNLGIDVSGLANSSTPRGADTSDKDFSPAIDVFDTPGAYHIHLSLPGAKKSDVDVSWDQENFQIIVSGIVHRPGDEEFLKTLAVEERDIGVFKREVKLGTKAQPASVDADGISAKMEDGVLMILVPKQEEGFVEVKKVDIE